MCGITGFYSSDSNLSLTNLKTMNDSLSHRGPDDHGFFESHGEVNVALGHRRLSILDLSENGKQPMYSHNKRYIMVYNGEVYNYNEIANELKIISDNPNRNTFYSSSDSEVILEAFSAWGPEFVHRLNGMFAIAIYDSLKKELHLFRDRVGIKPLYYFWDNNTFIFSSELKALLTLPHISKSISTEAVGDYLHLGFIPAPKTIYNEFSKMMSGSYIRINKLGFKEKSYWNTFKVIEPTVLRNEKEALVKLSDLLMSSVQYQLKSDVPFGVFLSGGIDSSLITAQAVNLSGVKVNTFSIGFKENRYNESVYAKRIAEYLGTNHNEFIVSYKDAIALIDELTDVYDEPFADSSAIPTMLVSKLAKQKVTVTLSGEGGDELFLGYGAYKWAKRLNNPTVYGSRSIIKYFLDKGSNKYKRAALLFNFNNSDPLSAHILSQEQYLFSALEVNHLIKPNNEFYQLKEFENEIKTLSRKLNSMERQSMFDLQYYLPYDLLTKVDRASMRYSLETRVPFLDHRIIEFALNLSPDLKFKNGISKYILKEILHQYIPPRYFDRPKQGFAIPLERWLSEELSFLIDEYLSEEKIKMTNILTFSEVEKLIKAFRGGKTFFYNKLWSLIVLQKFFIKTITTQ